WGSAFIVSFLLIIGISQVLTVLNGRTIGEITVHLEPIKTEYALAFAVIPTVLFAIWVRSFGRPIFVFLMLVMFLLATTELGTDSWIQDIMRSVLKDPTKGTMFLVYTA